ncbi:PAS domain S-box protein [Mangrovivirga cuniculi]|uniref:PAS domain-containing protein n=1 Tax=Mangrovivirga cuniculi TaxID=2715131 RepID=A0A4D7JLB8_9BACT|nr:PAS domain S-box protein [Mangrovivirga cuniculi]QCK16669.1 hypothetical protein DCC35_18995 [Mangrovivirga cuniculi]
MNITNKVFEEGDKIFRMIAENSMDAIIIIGNNLEFSEPKIEYANPAYLKLTGFSLEEVIGASPAIIKGEKTSQKMLDDLKEQMKQGNQYKGKAINYKKMEMNSQMSGQ